MRYAVKHKGSKGLASATQDTPEKAWALVHPSNREFFVVVGVREEHVPMKLVTTWVEDK